MFKADRSMISLRRGIRVSVVGFLLFMAVSAATYSGFSGLRDCPVTVNGPSFAQEGQPITYQASPTNYESYQWDVSTGEISGPKNSSSVTVVNVAAGSSCRATVTIRNGSCQSSSFHTTSVSAPACPTLTVACADSVEEGTPITFTASLTGNAAATFNWSVSAGQITQGQGTAAITVDTTGAGGQSITATVEVGGLKPNCTRNTSCTTAVIARPTARKIDEYTTISLSEERSRLKSYAEQLQNEPSAQGYIFVYGNERSASVQRRVQAIKDQLVRSLKVDAGRLVVQYGPARQPLSVGLWIVPNGATPPTAEGAP